MAPLLSMSRNSPLQFCPAVFPVGTNQNGGASCLGPWLASTVKPASSARLSGLAPPSGYSSFQPWGRTTSGMPLKD